MSDLNENLFEMIAANSFSPCGNGPIVDGRLETTIVKIAAGIASEAETRSTP